MILMADRKKQLNQILGDPSGGDSKESSLDQCAEGFMSAIASGDKATMLLCLRRLINHIDSMPEE